MRHWLFGLIALCAGALVPGDAPAQQGETRIALIIANEAYVSPNLGRLPGTQRDAALMQAALQRAGFQVSVRANLTRAQMRFELSSFANRLSQLGARGVGFLYYAGHGVADGARGQNYLVPVDAQISGVPDLPATSLALSDELDGIALAGARATILVIDACRNTPTALRRGGRGLAAVDARTDTLIAFSTEANETASDDGLYARVLSEELQRPGVDAIAVFARVQSRVAAATNREQRPRFDNGLLGEPIVFVPVSVASGAPSSSPSASTPSITALTPQLPAQAAVSRRPGDIFRDCADCPEMVVIPAGSFTMGSPANESDRASNEGPQQHITFSRNFAVGRTEVTRAQYAAFVRSTRRADSGGCYTDRDFDWRLAQDASGTWRDSGVEQEGSHPVVCVSWEDAQAYVAWLNGQVRTGAPTASTSGGSGPYQLLSEAEWEYVVRAGTTTAFWWGNIWDGGCSYENVRDLKVYALRPEVSALNCDDGALQTAPSGSYQANAFGLHDMAGNVEEWVRDCYENTLDSVPADGSAFSPSNCAQRVTRGGGWGDPPQYLRSSFRVGILPFTRDVRRGFRLARIL